MIMSTKKRYALLLAARDSDYVNKLYGGYFNVFVDTFGEKDLEEGDSWDLFRVIDGEFPQLDHLHLYQGFVISGSPHDAYGHESWILQLCFLVQTLFALHKKVLGVCFGHQVICRALGGKVGKSCSGWDIGVRKVKFTEDFYTSSLSSSVGLYGSGEVAVIPQNLSIIECHQDEVWEVPVGAQVLAFSEKTGVEMFAFGDNILGIQGHPEYTKDILNNLIDRLVSNNSIQREFGEEAKQQAMNSEPADRQQWQKICRRFLKMGCTKFVPILKL
ncbi:gamma-glutamyl peptidase 5-like [Andrographis paniculata]|uniref:gamma-glutamyl peptidase 5-like n=1 Tax=Andrographis paniculata TaxID=175694 RepID=UPI0021E86C44|nr:gamma-glutamyl peptidase 5-like [Andrographis paniculata]